MNFVIVSDQELKGKVASHKEQPQCLFSFLVTGLLGNPRHDFGCFVVLLLSFITASHFLQ